MQFLIAIFLILSMIFMPAPGSAGRGHELSGLASWYGGDLHGSLMANGRRFNMYAFTAAHKTLPLGTVLKVYNPRNGATIRVDITDRGPYIRGRIIDLSWVAAKELGLEKQGVGPVELTVLEYGKGRGNVPDEKPWPETKKPRQVASGASDGKKQVSRDKKKQAAPKLVASHEQRQPAPSRRSSLLSPSRKNQADLKIRAESRSMRSPKGSLRRPTSPMIAELAKTRSASSIRGLKRPKFSETKELASLSLRGHGKANANAGRAARSRRDSFSASSSRTPSRLTASLQRPRLKASSETNRKPRPPCKAAARQASRGRR